MKKLDVLRLLIGGGAAFCVGAVMEKVVEANTPSGIKLATKIIMGIGTLIISGIAADVVGDYVDESIDTVMDVVNEMASDDEEVSDESGEG